MIVCPVTVVRVMLKISKGTLGKRLYFDLFCFVYCELVSVPWYKGGNPTCDRLKKNWVCCGNTYFFKEFLNKKLSNASCQNVCMV